MSARGLWPGRPMPQGTHPVPPRDEKAMNDAALIQIVDRAMAEAQCKSGAWIACRPGCAHCCIGAFPISRLDAWRLRCGLVELDDRDPGRAGRVRVRAREWSARQAPYFPGDAATGLLEETVEAEARFERFADHEPCPALDPDTGTCDLYAWRPLTCRTFGPAVRLGGGAVGACELCYRGATDEEIAACEVTVDVEALEAGLAPEMAGGKTVVAFALSDPDQEARRLVRSS
jgi:Fe-S-cluster containining protein